MRALLTSAALALCLVGCGRPPEAQTMAREYVKAWPQMGMWLPTDQVAFFREHFQEVEEVLADGLRDANPDIRQRAAYVIEELGPDSESLEDELRVTLQTEQNRLVRLYLYCAMRSIGASDPASMKELRERFERTVPGKPEGGWDIVSARTADLYTDTDEAIYIASALFALDDQAKRRPEYLDTVIQWLKPPDSELSQEALRAYWDHRWCAVNAVEHMQGAEEAMPLLERMLEEEGRKAWVSVHVARALRALQGSSPSQRMAEPE